MPRATPKATYDQNQPAPQDPGAPVYHDWEAVELPVHPDHPPPHYSPLKAPEILDKYLTLVPELSSFGIYFFEAGLTDLIEVARQSFPYLDEAEIVVKALRRTFHAVVAVLSVEWRSGHIRPYNQHRISFKRNFRFSEEHPPALWLQRLDIIVEATSSQQLPGAIGPDAAHIAASTGLSKLTRFSPLPSFPLSEPHRTRLRSSSSSQRLRLALPSNPLGKPRHHFPPSTSGRLAKTAIDSSLKAWDISSMGERPLHEVWVDRFTRAESAHVAPGMYPVWWQWAGTRKAVLQGEEAYAKEFNRQHGVESSSFPESRTEPALLLIFRMSPVHPQPRSSGSASPGVLRR